MQNRYWKALLCSTGLLASTGCGGGGGGAVPGGGTGVVTPTPTPNPAPTPAPPPPPPTSSSPFGSLGQTTSQDFAVLGYAYRGSDNGFGLNPDLASLDTARSIGLSFASPSALSLSIGGYGTSVLTPNGGSGTSPVHGLVSLSYNALVGNAVLYRALRPDAEAYLTSTAYGAWQIIDDRQSQFPYLAVEFVYGVPTPAAAMPTSGAAMYAAQYFRLSSLNVDFGARTVTGSLTVGEGTSATTYLLEGGTLTSDRTSFQATMRSTATTAQGIIHGRFAGPGANEMLARFVTRLPNGQASAFAAFAAQRQ